MQQFSKFNNSILDDGFGLAPRKIFKDERLNGYSKLIYLCISSYTNISFENAQAFPSINRIAEECGIGKTTAIKYLKQLEEYGYITVKKTVRDDGGFSNNIYLLNAVLGSPDEQGLVREMNKGLFAECTTPSSPDEQGLVRQVNPNNTNKTILYNNTNKTNNNGQQADQESAVARFEKLWAIYPKKARKKDAFNAYKRAIKNGVTDEEIKTGIENYKAQIKAQGTDKQFIAQGGTWFNQERWNDEYDTRPTNGIDRYMLTRGDEDGL